MQEDASAGESVRIMPVRGSEKRLPHLEELGNETLVYGDLDLKNESVVESKTKMILKTASFQDIAPGDIIHIAFQPEELHFFDLDTGKAKVGETMLLVAVDALPREKKVRLTLDLEKISVKEKRRNIQIL